MISLLEFTLHKKHRKQAVVIIFFKKGIAFGSKPTRLHPSSLSGTRYNEAGSVCANSCVRHGPMVHYYVGGRGGTDTDIV